MRGRILSRKRPVAAEMNNLSILRTKTWVDIHPWTLALSSGDEMVLPPILRRGAWQRGRQFHLCCNQWELWMRHGVPGGLGTKHPKDHGATLGRWWEGVSPRICLESGVSGLSSFNNLTCCFPQSILWTISTDNNNCYMENKKGAFPRSNGRNTRLVKGTQVSLSWDFSEPFMK